LLQKLLSVQKRNGSAITGFPAQYDRHEGDAQEWEDRRIITATITCGRYWQ
jgi:hypothetical protein